MKQLPLNHSALFKLFDGEKSSKTGRVLSTIGIILFVLSTVSFAIFSAFGGSTSETPTPVKVIGGLSSAFLMLGLLMFIATGIHYIGRSERKSNFLSSLLHVLSRTFLYLILPASIIGCVVVLILLLSGATLD